MRQGQVRAIAICLIHRANEIFVAKGFDNVKESHFYRPLGGKIEFGEYGYRTVAREFQEEIGAELTGIRYLFTLENLFSFEGKRGHEIVRVYEGSFADASLYERVQVEGKDDGDVIFTALWMPLEIFRRGEARLVPERLLELLNERG